MQELEKAPPGNRLSNTPAPFPFSSFGTFQQSLASPEAPCPSACCILPSLEHVIPVLYYAMGMWPHSNVPWHMVSNSLLLLYICPQIYICKQELQKGFVN